MKDWQHFLSFKNTWDFIDAYLVCVCVCVCELLSLFTFERKLFRVAAYEKRK
jgi:hypothetical protein